MGVRSILSNSGGIGIDKCAASSRQTAISPDEFIIYDDEEEIGISSDLAAFKQVYDCTLEYLTANQNSGDTDDPTVFNVNRNTLAYLRSEHYDTSVSMGDLISAGFTNIESILKNAIKGFGWWMFAGNRSSDYVSTMETVLPSIVPETLKFSEPSGHSLGCDHFAAVMGSIVTSTFGFVTAFTESRIDAYTGWAAIYNR